MAPKQPCCKECGWTLAFSWENDRWVGRCWNLPQLPNKPFGCKDAGVEVRGD